MLAKRFAGGQLVLAGANSAVGLRSMPARFLFLDEVDAYPGDVDGEGDPIALTEARTRAFGHRRKVLIGSTPTIKGLSRIEREYEATDQCRFFAPCPHCGHRQWLQFEQSWEEIARDWEPAQGNDALMKTAVNTLLGLTWQERGEAPDWRRLFEREKEHALGRIPARGLVLTAGADVQADRIEVDVWAWGRGLESWLVDHVLLEGDTSAGAVWAALTERLAREWPHDSGAVMRIARLAIGSGDGRTTSQVYS